MYTEDQNVEGRVVGGDKTLWPTLPNMHLNLSIIQMCHVLLMYPWDASPKQEQSTEAW